MTTGNDRVAQLRRMVNAGIATPEETAELRGLITNETTAPVPAAAQPSGNNSAASNFIPLNTEAFERGGNQTFPPRHAGVFPGVCTGYRLPDFVQDQLWFEFEAAPESTEQFKGVLVTAALNAPSARSGAWKVKDVVDALAITYAIVPGKGLSLGDVRGRKCQVSWEEVDIKGVRELRIQNVYSADRKIESAVE